jgi:hypothetical protein
MLDAVDSSIGTSVLTPASAARACTSSTSSTRSWTVNAASAQGSSGAVRNRRPVRPLPGSSTRPHRARNSRSAQRTARPGFGTRAPRPTNAMMKRGDILAPVRASVANLADRRESHADRPTRQPPEHMQVSRASVRSSHRDFRRPVRLFVKCRTAFPSPRGQPEAAPRRTVFDLGPDPLVGVEGERQEPSLAREAQTAVERKRTGARMNG